MTFCKSLLPIAALLCLAALPALGQVDHERNPAPRTFTKPERAQTLLDAALKKAKAQKKSVFVVFDASW